MNTVMMMEATDEQRVLHDTHAYLRACCADLENSDLFARMLASQAAGQGDMPDRLGLTPSAFRTLLRTHFPGVDPERYAQLAQREDGGRRDERDELLALFLAHARADDEERWWVAEILAAGCMGGDHLWQDLGLWSRKDLSALISRNFPALAANNTKDMKWKKFFYKQLCIQEGVYTCRAPSCEVCADYAACFGPED